MLVLDTDHLSEIERTSAGGKALELRLMQSGKLAVTTIVSAEEQLRGWLSQIKASRSLADQVDPYVRLQTRIAYYAKWTLLPWTTGAAHRFATMRKAGVRIGTMDLKIAVITIEHDGLLLSQNVTDFSRVPGLRVESWL